MTSKSVQRHRTRRYGFSIECKLQKRILRQEYRKLKAGGFTEELISSYNAQKITDKEAIKNHKKLFFEKLTLILGNVNNSKEFRGTIHAYKKRHVVNPNNINLEMWENLFDQTYNKDQSTPDVHGPHKTDEKLDADITKTRIRRGIKKSKNART